MKHIYFSLFLALIVSFSQAQIVNIPDTNLKTKLLNHIPIIDTNQNGEIQVSEAINFNGELNLDNEYNASEDIKITDMTGIEEFVNINGLSLDDNLVSDIDISNNTLLTSLSCYNNLLTTLNVSQNQSLAFLNCQSNQLTSLDVTENNLLSSLYCLDNRLTSIDVSQNESLIILRCDRNEISTLDVGNQLGLENLSCSFNQLDFIDVSNNTSLTSLICSDNSISNLDISKNLLLTNLTCGGNLLSNLDIEVNTALKFLDFGQSQINSIDLSKATQLERLICDRTQITTLDVSNNTFLTRLVTYDVPLKEIDVSNNTELQFFTTGDNLLTTIDLSQNPKLRSVSCTNAYLLTNINLKNTTNITTLISIMLRNCPNLRTVCVDDANYANENFAVRGTSQRVEPNVTFVEDCSTILPFNTIQGNIKYDLDNNGCDNLDINVPNTLIKAINGLDELATLTNANGDYTINVIDNNYEVYPTQMLNFNNMSINPALHNFNLIGYENTVFGDFCTLFNQVVNDVNVVLIPTTKLKPGVEAKYQIIYENLGSSSSDGTISFQFNESMTSFVSSNPVEDNSTSSTLSFNYTDLKPFEKRVVDIAFNTFASPTVSEDDVLSFEVNISSNTADDLPENNFYSFDQHISDLSFTNEKQVLQGDEITIGEITNYLDYVIHFQNTGAITANNIAITDIINTNLDWDTIRILSSSNDFTTKITNRRFVEFIFDNINLPSKHDDDIASRGFIAFRVKPKDTLNVGDIISSKTEVYYDLQQASSGKSSFTNTNYNFSESISTNTVSTKIIAGTLSVNKNETDLSAIIVYPNPTKNKFYIKMDIGLKISKVSIFSISGSKVFETKKDLTVFDISNYKSGVYFLKVQTNQGVFNKRIVKN